MEKKNIDWSSLGFGYIKTDKRFVANYKDGAWDNGTLKILKMLKAYIKAATSMSFSMHRHVLKVLKLIQQRMVTLLCSAQI